MTTQKQKPNPRIPAIANTLNADLIPKVKKWLEKKHPEANFTDSNLSTLMCYALAPDDFKMTTATDAVNACKNGKSLNLEDALTLLPDAGIILVHKLMTRHPIATVATLAQFQHEDQKLMKNKIRKALRRENLEFQSGNELVQYLADKGQIHPDQIDSARRRLQEMRNEDLQNIDSKNRRYHDTGYKE
ncbi:hypothetical protein QEH59_03020 [Coraliomargarita sp. SDUM461004]|uniref:Uncharacterized protein n=1 Tax=Thalassobacterium sedimentorum TaxID=3041258 RepID=A0ABU1AF55_9BACT|nr:hypothetical protein [Coraliomargarita sp. SDUM461004]MDQ8193380.1 hypothetical protein [Coraliomargarita sp. SDUM461004]